MLSDAVGFAGIPREDFLLIRGTQVGNQLEESGNEPLSGPAAGKKKKKKTTTKKKKTKGACQRG